MGILDFVGGIFSPLTTLIEHVVPSGDEKIKLQQEIVKAQFAAADKVMDYERQLLDSQAKIVTAEATGQSWLQRNWRPITMMTFLVLVVLDSFGVLPFRLAASAWTLIQVGLGGYVGGRSVEKIAPAIAAALKR